MNLLFSSPARRLFLALCLVLAGFTMSARADNIPKFSDPAVNEYCKKFSAAVDRVVAAKKAKDDVKEMEAMLEIVDLQAKNAGDIAMKLQMSEVDAYHEFLQAQHKRIEDAN